MPKLKSGRHFALETKSFADRAAKGSDAEMYAFALMYRFQVHGPDDSARFLPVLYFKEGEGEPPDAPVYRSGFTVGDIVDGNAGWSKDEIEELQAWIAKDENVQDWLRKDFEATDLAIRKSPLWESEFMNDW